MSTDDLPRHLQLLWNMEPAGRRGPRPSKSIHDLADAAVTLGDEGGIDAVTIQGVARLLGMSPMSLYRYVDSRDALLVVVTDRLVGPPPEPAPGDLPWRDRISSWALTLASRHHAHPWALDAPLHPAETPNLLGWMERGLEALEPLGLGPSGTASGLLLVDTFVSGHVRTSHRLGATTLEGGQGVTARTRAVLDRVLDPRAMPRVAAQRDVAFGHDVEPFYEVELRAGLEVILDGLEAAGTRVG